MNRKLPPLNALRAFEMAARYQSLTAAAAQLHVTHSAVSRQVALLEEWLGVALFERLGRRLRLTDAGRQYLPVVQAAFDSIANATEKLTSQKPRLLRINAAPTLAMHWLLPRLTQFQRRHPEVELRLATSDAIINNQNADFDIAIRRGNDHWPGFVSNIFLTEHELPVASPALLARQPLPDAAALAQHTLCTRKHGRWRGSAGWPLPACPAWCRRPTSISITTIWRCRRRWTAWASRWGPGR